MALFAFALLGCAGLAAASPLHLLASGVVIHPHPPDATRPRTRIVEDDSLYMRCSPIPTTLAFVADGEDQPSLHQLANRAVGLHAVLPVEHVSKNSSAAVNDRPVENAYTLGEWDALEPHGGSEALLCELYSPVDMTQEVAVSGTAQPHFGGGVLRKSDFAGQHAVDVSFAFAGSDAEPHSAATMTFICALCAFGESGSPEGVAKVLVAKAAADSELAKANSGLVDAIEQTRSAMRDNADSGAHAWTAHLVSLGQQAIDQAAEPGGGAADGATQSQFDELQADISHELARAFNAARKHGDGEIVVSTLAHLTATAAKRFDISLGDGGASAKHWHRRSASTDMIIRALLVTAAVFALIGAGAYAVEKLYASREAGGMRPLARLKRKFSDYPLSRVEEKPAPGVAAPTPETQHQFVVLGTPRPQ
jgi:hypothetical protein